MGRTADQTLMNSEGKDLSGAATWLFLLILFSWSAVCPAEELRPFTSDGCSLFPDGSIKNPGQWCICCYQHDIAYWQGGGREDRLRADEELRDCVAQRTGDTALAKIMYDGVRTGGHPVFPTWYRWGYGWKYGRGYRPLTPPEQAAVAEKLEEYQRDHPGGYCAKNSHASARGSIRLKGLP